MAAIRDNSDEFEVALPEIVSENIGSFRFEHAGFSDFYPDLSLDLHPESLGPRLAALTLDDLEKHTVAAYGENENRPFQYWSVHRALVGSLVLDGERYALNEGHWYRIGKNFKEAADRKFSEVCGPPDKKLRPLKKIGLNDGKGKKQNITYQSEDFDNIEIAQETGYLLLDRKLIQIDDVPGPGIKVCDLLDIPADDLSTSKRVLGNQVFSAIFSSKVTCRRRCCGNTSLSASRWSRRSDRTTERQRLRN